MVFGWSLGAQRSMNGDGWGRGSDCERHLRALEGNREPFKGAEQKHDSQHLFAGQLKAMQFTVTARLHAPRGQELILFTSVSQKPAQPAQRKYSTSELLNYSRIIRWRTRDSWNHSCGISCLYKNIYL